MHFLYTRDELVVEAGQSYRAELKWIPYREKGITEGEPVPIPMDLRPWIYGDTNPGAMPAIYNLGVSYEGKGNMTLKWGATFPCPVTDELVARDLNRTDRPPTN